ncbi:hypothetical protein MKX01_009201 [Papaver californicum]|nr:hypothetical protein MKX01_009201 [Papaver californicum]
MEKKKIHVVCIPLPLQSHITSMMKLAKILHFRGIHITFVNTEFNHQRLLNARGIDSMKGLPDFHFETIPDGLPPPTDSNVTQDVIPLCISTQTNCLEPFRDLIYRLNSIINVPPVSCIVADGCMSFTLEAAKEFGIQVMMYWPISFSSFVCILHFPNLIQRGLVPIKDENYLTNGYLDTPIDGIPGVKDIRFRDLPSNVRTTDPNDPMFDFLMRETGRSYDATGLIFNTFDALETEVLNALKSPLPLPPIYTVGPLHLLLNQIPLSDLSQSLGSNLWKEDTNCLKWLDFKEPNSVVYVNFGSITVMTAQQLVEFAWGLANSNHNFLWVIRPDLVVGESATLPPEFAEEIKERGVIASWCPQEDVLHHASIAGFLTHCGWNSILESLSCAVPMICWPFFAEQPTNCRYLCSHWEVGMEIDSNVERDGVERLVRELMEGDKGKEMKKRTLEWKQIAAEATLPGGSSYVNIDKIVSELTVLK